MGEEGIFGVFLSILGLSLFKQEGREDLKRAKVRKLTLTPSLMILDSRKKTLTLCKGDFFFLVDHFWSCFSLSFKVILG